MANQSNFITPIAIVIAGLLVAGGFYFSDNKTPTNQLATTDNIADQTKEALAQLTPISAADHIRGNPNAPIKIVEYSDFECPFCKRFHGTMNQIMADYGQDGQVAWVYRHFPLDNLHPVKARAEAVATECANELGGLPAEASAQAGNEAFWQYADRFFELSPSNNQTDIATILPLIAQELGLDENKFKACLESGRYDERIQVDIDNAVATGGEGTPWSIVVTASGKKYPLSGAQSYETVKQLIERALAEE